MKNAIRISLIHIGILIGAGFATGQEFVQFFLNYGTISYFALAIVCILFGFFLYLFLERIRINDFSDLSSYFGGGKAASLINILITIYMLCSYIIMTAAIGSVAADLLNLNKTLGISFFSAFCLTVFLNNKNGIIWLNSLLTPIIIIGTVVLGFLTINLPLNIDLPIQNNGIVLSAFLYISYNSITIIPVLLGIKDIIKSRATSIISALFSSLLLFLTSSCIWLIIAQNPSSLNSEIPMAIALNQNFKMIYIIVLTFAIITTAASSGFGFINNTKFLGKKSLIILLLCGILISTFGFSNLVARLYTFFGFLGFLIFLPIIGNNSFIRRMRNNDKS